ncbi:MAG: hypothetical protein QXE23_09145 [Nitrososphaerota archaeon]
MSAQQGKQGANPPQPPQQCNPSDFACIALQYHELYKYAVGTEGCIDPPACTKPGKRPASILAGIFKACNEEAAGDVDKFEACVADLAGLLEKAAQKVVYFRK